MKTILLNEETMQKGVEIIKQGGVVAIPTETVYGLSANALNPQAIKSIFQAKGRPMDNPLIVHVANFDDIKKLVLEIPNDAYILAKKFWPGPLTIIMKKSDIIPNEVSGGLNTVAIRIPKHPLARKFISECGLPLAAPSANISGKPSPTTANHVLNDLNGVIPAILDGGACTVGLESTVITLTTEKPTILRPGGITFEQIKEVLEDVKIDSAVLCKLEDDKKAISPGMKYKHYSPNAKVVIVNSSDTEYSKYVNNFHGDNVGAICYDEDVNTIMVKTYPIGRKKDEESHAKNLFARLREIDEDKIEKVFARCPSKEGIGLALYNRLIRAAGFEVIDIA